ncbi:Eco57I restriction-modification methylase domain-containing protein [Brachyspira aalborgi]|uniref:site-specific DNA-methyltransferase (adenine-specific) n=1 Tax=Brachyspira aalborgi TaxID=29522 RepID=A0A5C8FTB0_9SPIR|nr:DNA methyltransferase [Brachyspira aalborgi]TXJ52883.1 methyltransferase [Brachyspira aalborgi]
MSANSKNKEEAYNGIKELVEKFKSNYKQFHSSDYNETLTRQDFINPFFEYLGWDISNKEGLSQTYRDVIHEDKLKIGKETKAPDYSFRIGGNRVFFVEAKKPNRNLKEDSDAAYQIRRYAWSGKLAVSILTDFEEFAIYDCSKKPSPNDKASMSRIEYINYEDYLNRFDFLYDTFAKENVLRGSLEKYNADTKSKKGTESVDIDFLNSLDDLRTKLASNISKLNSLSLRDLNFAVQHIIDRIIFLRVAEDRGVENYGDLRGACCGNNYYKNIVEIFKKSDGKYNSGIFDFSKDKITQNIEVDNKVIKEIINDLYYPKSPYEFSVISVEIIGNAYEQFLGKTITIGKNNAKSGQMPKAKIELKPEVRKAGGVYYTPEYIVDYIVENTVGEKIKGKTPKEIANIKIVDPACGSGSFLIGAYKYLLNYHREYYSKQGKKKFLGSKEDAITEDGELALWVKKQILINNIFGVDIDSNAVEVTKLSLLLKCMENETPASIMNNQSLFNERALPSLDENIKCGNSLIGNDFYSGGDSLNIDIETQYKINCFDWEDEFKNVFACGGFDVVIGNPPYGAELSEIERNYLEKKFSLSNTNTAALFLGVLKNFLKDNCRGCYIIPKSFIYASNWESSRDLMIDDLFELVDCGKVWKEVKLEQVITLFEKGFKNDSYITSIREDKEIKRIGDINKNTYKEFGFYLNAVSNDELNIAYKMNVSKKYINDYCINKLEGSYQSNLIDEEKKDTLKVLGGKHINRYYYPNIIKGYLEKKYIVNNKGLIKNNSILVQNIVAHIMNPTPHIKIIAMPSSILDNKDEYILLNTVNQLENISNLDTKFILAILNSKLISWYVYIFIFGLAIRTMHFDNPVTSRIPMPVIDLSNSSHKEVHDKIVVLVDNIIELNKKVNTEKNPNSLNMINRQILACEKQLNVLIYRLYGLSEDNIRTIEEK